MAISFTPAKKRRLGELLMDSGLVTEQQLRLALTEQRKWGGRLGRTLVQLGFVDEQAMVTALSRQLNLPVADLDGAELDATMAQHLRYEAAERYGVCPLSTDARRRVLRIATSDPTNADVLQALTFQTGMKLELVVSSAGAIERALGRIYGREKRPAVPAAPSPGALGEKLESLASRIAELEAKVEGQSETIRQLLAKLDGQGQEAEHAPAQSTRADEETSTFDTGSRS